MNPVVVSYNNQSINLTLDFNVLLDNPDISKRLVDRMSEKKRAELNQHKSYIDREKNKMKKEREETRHRELAYIAKLDQERALSQHYYMTIKAMIHLLKSDASDEKKVDSMWKLMEEMGY